MHDGVRKIDSASDHMYIEETGHERALVSSRIASAEISRDAAVQDRVVGYHKRFSREAWRRGFLKYCESADRIGIGTCAHVGGAIEEPVTLEATGKKSWLPHPGATGSVGRKRLLPGRPWELYRGDEFLRESGQEELKKTRKFLFVK